MEQILLGTEGNQPFPITQSGVSRRHARITIDDYGKWTLEDLHSTNGTFIRDKDGIMRRISSVNIEPMTFICLGPDNANGCSFYACHLKNTRNYFKEFEYLNEIEDLFDAAQNKAERKARVTKMSIALVSLIALAISLIIQFCPPVVHLLHVSGINPGELNVNLLRIGSAFSGICTLLYDPKKDDKEIKHSREKYHRCPNPKCSHLLKTSEIRNMQCGKCKNK